MLRSATAGHRSQESGIASTSRAMGPSRARVSDVIRRWKSVPEGPGMTTKPAFCRVALARLYRERTIVRLPSSLLCWHGDEHTIRLPGYRRTNPLVRKGRRGPVERNFAHCFLSRCAKSQVGNSGLLYARSQELCCTPGYSV